MNKKQQALEMLKARYPLHAPIKVLQYWSIETKWYSEIDGIPLEGYGSLMEQLEAIKSKTTATVVMLLMEPLDMSAKNKGVRSKVDVQLRDLFPVEPTIEELESYFMGIL